MPKKKLDAGRGRLNIDISPQAQKQMDKLAKLLDSSSKAETIRRALDIAVQVVGWHRHGGKLFMIKDGKEREIVIL